eukprot:2608010-Amphidinium_carterae.1
MLTRCRRALGSWPFHIPLLDLLPLRLPGLVNRKVSSPGNTVGFLQGAAPSFPLLRGPQLDRLEADMGKDAGLDLPDRRSFQSAQMWEQLEKL